MFKTLALAGAATFALASLAQADTVVIQERDPEPTNSIVIKERQDPDVVVKKKKVIVREDNDADIKIKGTVDLN